MDTLKLAEAPKVIIDTVEYVKKTDVIVFYKDVASSQATQFTILISVLCGLVVLIISATWWWNYSASKKQITSEIDDAKKAFQRKMNAHKNTIAGELKAYEEAFNQAKGKLQESVNRQIEEKIKQEIESYNKDVSKKITAQYDTFKEDSNFSRAELARMFALHNESVKEYIIALDWWCEGLEYYSKSNCADEWRGQQIRSLYVVLENVDIDMIDENTSFTCDKNIATANKFIPDIMSVEKKAILKKLNEIKTKMDSFKTD